MKDLFELLKNKEIAIYGLGKRQEDFEYIFHWIDVKYYISKTYNKKTYHGKLVFTPANMNKTNLFIINCEDSKTANNELVQYGFTYESTYINMEDLFYLLDKNWNEPWDYKKLVIWGTGNTCKDLLSAMEENQYRKPVEYFIDSNANKEEYHLGIRIYSPQVINDLDKNTNDTLIIVANGAYESIKYELLRQELVEGQNFTNFNGFLKYLKRRRNKPSEMLKKTVNAEPINAPFCSEPFETAVISDVIDCCFCEGLVMAPIGDPYKENFGDIWKSISARIFRLSIINKTFCFCKRDCKNIPGKPAPGEGRYEYNGTIGYYPKKLYINIDESCNLYCTSCRNQINTARGEKLEDHKIICDKLIKSGWLENVENIILSSYGEIFFSTIYLQLLKYLSNIKNKKITIITNLLLFTEDKWKIIEGNFQYIEFLVSIDGATRKTYEAIRRGGKWDILQDRLLFLSNLRKSREVNRVQINMVVQKSNYEEMEMFIEMAKRYSFDKVHFQLMYDFGTFNDSNDYYEKAMINNDKTLKNELKDILSRIHMDPIVDIEAFQYNNA